MALYSLYSLYSTLYTLPLASTTTIINTYHVKLSESFPDNSDIKFLPNISSLLHLSLFETLPPTINTYNRLCNAASFFFL